MTAYTRQPKKAIAKCEAPGCGWVRIFFDWHQPVTTFTAQWTPELRAQMALVGHQNRVHRQKVLINGR